MRILFIGTPEFAVKPLEALDRNYDVIGVVTQPDKRSGRHMTMLPSAVKKYALENGIQVYQPETFKDRAFENTLHALFPDIITVVAYGKILPEYVLDFPKYGCVNLHASLLPKYRGAAPMQRAIMNGEKYTGVTTMLMSKGLDTGDMLEKACIPIERSDNLETIHDRLSIVGAHLLVSTVAGLKAGTITPKRQDEHEASYACKIENVDCIIDFTLPANNIFNRIRALSPFPLAFCLHNKKILKIIDSEPCNTSCSESVLPGTVLSCDSGIITVKCGEGALAIKALLPEGRKRMSAADYINGRRIVPGDILEKPVV